MTIVNDNTNETFKENNITHTVTVQKCLAEDVVFYCRRRRHVVGGSCCSMSRLDEKCTQCTRM